MFNSGYLHSYRCTLCGKSYPTENLIYLCTDCGRDYRQGQPLTGVLEALYDYKAIGKQWRDKRDLALFSPISKKYYPEIPVGNTPFYRSLRLEKALSYGKIYIKNDTLNLSGSLKDRASLAMVAEAKRLKIDTIVGASTGNAASSLAAISASAGLNAVIFVPQKTPPAKLKQISIHGAELHQVAGDYDLAFAQSLDYSEKIKCLNRNTAYHPLTIEGKKTAGLEIFVQNECRTPDWIVVPTGDGVILTGVYEAFLDLKRSGIITHLPRMVAVQNETSAAIVKYWQSDVYRNSENPETIADSISVKTPSNAFWAKEIITASAGLGITVTDQDIITARKDLAVITGIFAEPAAAAAYAGLKKAISHKLVKKQQQVVLLITGHGLKDV